MPFPAGPARPTGGHEAHEDTWTVEGALRIGRAVGPEVPTREAVRQLQQPRALPRRHWPLDDLGRGLDEDARVLGVRVVGHVEADARIVADMPHPEGVLAA